MPKSANQQPTTTQSLGSLLKSARDIMRKDKGLNGDLGRLPLLTWIMFLKFLDDLEIQREQEAKLSGKKFKPAVEKPYRWRDWAAQADGITGDELLSFINSEETTRPDGKRGAGLFRYLRTLADTSGDDRRDVISTVFKVVDNRMKIGYLLRDVVNKIAGIHFKRGIQPAHHRPPAQRGVRALHRYSLQPALLRPQKPQRQSRHHPPPARRTRGEYP
jgi:type I restriction enzyme M protein